MARILYNTTFFGRKALAESFRNFIKDVYAPASRRAGAVSILALSVRPEEEDDDAFRIAVQLVADNENVLDAYRRDIQPVLLQEVTQRYGQQILWMASTMDVIE